MFRHSVLLIYLFLVGCASQHGTTSSSTSGKYSEDLSIWRPKVEGVKPDTNPSVTSNDRNLAPYIEPKFTINQSLDAVLDSIDRINLSRKFMEGFTIQVYSGSKREDALNAKKQLTTFVPDIESELQYMQPNFRVKAGKYFQRLDAQKDYLEVKQYFPNAIVVPDKIAMN